ncbi:hypothetical protein ACFX2C_006436 [Malus domestica]
MPPQKAQPHHRHSFITPSFFLFHAFIHQSWAFDSWKSKQVHQLPVYPDPDELRDVLTTQEMFPPIAFARYARRLEM